MVGTAHTILSLMRNFNLVAGPLTSLHVRYTTNSCHCPVHLQLEPHESINNWILAPGISPVWGANKRLTEHSSTITTSFDLVIET
jgi:hypothetical protein